MYRWILTRKAAALTSMEGMRKARVLPVPVLALASTSTPEMMIGRVPACTGVMCVYLLQPTRTR